MAISFYFYHFFFKIWSRSWQCHLKIPRWFFGIVPWNLDSWNASVKIFEDGHSGIFQVSSRKTEDLTRLLESFLGCWEHVVRTMTARWRHQTGCSTTVRGAKINRRIHNRALPRPTVTRYSAAMTAAGCWMNINKIPTWFQAVFQFLLIKLVRFWNRSRLNEARSNQNFLIREVMTVSPSIYSGVNLLFKMIWHDWLIWSGIHYDQNEGSRFLNKVPFQIFSWNDKSLRNMDKTLKIFTSYSSNHFKYLCQRQCWNATILFLLNCWSHLNCFN